MLTVVVVEVILLVVALGYALISVARPSHVDRRAAEAERREAANWRGAIYVNRDNPALFVPKRHGIGWTVNFGHPISWVAIGALIGVPLLTAIIVSE